MEMLRLRIVGGCLPELLSIHHILKAFWNSDAVRSKMGDVKAIQKHLGCRPKQENGKKPKK